MKIAIMGPGGIARILANTMRQMADVECYAVASRSLERAEKFKDEFGFSKAYGSYEEMLQDADVELVYIATLHPHHYEHDKTGPKLVQNLCNRLKAPVSWKKCGITAAKEHMKGGIFFKLRPGKKVEFIETIAKTILGLEGMEIVVLSDKSGTRNEHGNEVEFRKIGEQMLKEIDGKYLEEKYNIKPDKNFAEKLHQERIKWLINKY